MKQEDIKKRLGFLAQPKDDRDRLYMPFHSAESLPPRVDLSALCPPIVNQGELGSCVANSTASAFRFALKKQRRRDFQPSRLFIYYNARLIGGTEGEDSGTYIRDGFKTIGKDGVCVESSWKYDIVKFAEKPPARTYKSAERHQAIEYKAVEQNLASLKGCIADGFPFVFGFSVYASFERVGKDGIMPYPQYAEQYLGGHAVYSCGYNDATERFKIGNSWGVRFGDKGYFYMPYSFITNRRMASDFWAIRLVEG